jgi:hypothetical protein
MSVLGPRINASVDLSHLQLAIHLAHRLVLPGLSSRATAITTRNPNDKVKE